MYGFEAAATDDDDDDAGTRRTPMPKTEFAEPYMASMIATVEE